MDLISKNLKALTERIEKAARDCGRDAKEICLVAVSKTKPHSMVAAALEAGQLDFGENYVQGLKERFEHFEQKNIRWHFIGHLQKNKVKFLLKNTYLIHTIDNLKLAHTIERLCSEQNIIQKALIQVNISQEPQKSGCSPDQVTQLLTELNELNHLSIEGLMMVGSDTDDKKIKHREFKMLRDLRDSLNTQAVYRRPLKELSMGMSSDFELAITEGATLIRVGSEIFGRRH